jgi:hypothetical protein
MKCRRHVVCDSNFISESSPVTEDIMCFAEHRWSFSLFCNVFSKANVHLCEWDIVNTLGRSKKVQCECPHRCRIRQLFTANKASCIGRISQGTHSTAQHNKRINLDSLDQLTSLTYQNVASKHTDEIMNERYNWNRQVEILEPLILSSVIR